MSRDGSSTHFFGDADYRFRLALGEFMELQEKTGFGPDRTLSRLRSGDWHVQEIREPIRIGLIGGGLAPDKANALVKRYVDEVPDWQRNRNLAFAVLGDALQSDEEDKPGKPKAKRPKK